MRIEKPRAKKFFGKISAIRVYLPELMKEIDQTVERGERPRLLIKRTLRTKTGEPEVEVVFLGGARERHVEALHYYEKRPAEWKTWGELVFPLEGAKEFARCLLELILKPEELEKLNQSLEWRVFQVPRLVLWKAVGLKKIGGRRKNERDP